MKNLLLTDLPDDYTRTFWRNCKEHSLTFQRCNDCGHVRWPLSFICPRCSSQGSEWVQSDGSKGRVYTYIVFHAAFHPDIIGKTPYVVAVIELKEGPHFLAKIIGCNHTQIHCNMAVEVVWEDVSSELSFPSFQPLALR